MPSTPAIFQALYTHSTAQLNAYIQSGGDINAVDEEGCPLLVRTIMLHHKDMTMALLNAGADVNKGWNKTGQELPETTALIESVMNVWKDVVDVLLAHKAHVNQLDREGESALHWSVLGADPEHMERTFDCYTICKTLLEHGADPNVRLGYGPTPLSEATEWPIRFSFAKELIKHGGDINVLHDPLANLTFTDDDLVRFDLSREEAKIDERDLMTPLALLVNNHITELTDHVRDERGRFRDTGRYLESSFDNNIEQIVFLLDQGADVHAKADKGVSALELVRLRQRQDLNVVFEEFLPKKPALTVIRGGKTGP